MGSEHQCLPSDFQVSYVVTCERQACSGTRRVYKGASKSFFMIPLSQRSHGPCGDLLLFFSEFVIYVWRVGVRFLTLNLTFRFDKIPVTRLTVLKLVALGI